MRAAVAQLDALLSHGERPGAILLYDEAHLLALRGRHEEAMPLLEEAFSFGRPRSAVLLNQLRQLLAPSGSQGYGDLVADPLYQPEILPLDAMEQANGRGPSGGDEQWLRMMGARGAAPEIAEAVLGAVHRGGAGREAHGEDDGDVGQAAGEPGLRRPATRLGSRAEAASQHDEHGDEQHEAEALEQTSGEGTGEVALDVGVLDAAGTVGEQRPLLKGEPHEDEHDVDEREGAGDAPEPYGDV